MEKGNKKDLKWKAKALQQISLDLDEFFQEHEKTVSLKNYLKKETQKRFK